MLVLVYARTIDTGAFRGSVPKYFSSPQTLLSREVCFRHIPN